MFKYFDPQQILLEYHRRFGVSLHNQDSQLAAVFAQKILEGRDLIGDYFGFQPSEISFQPAAFWAWKLLLQTCSDQQLAIYATNLNLLKKIISPDDWDDHSYHQLVWSNYLNDPDKLIVSWSDPNLRLVIVINEITSNISYDQLIKFLTQLNDKLVLKPIILIDLSLFFYQDLKLISRYISGFIFNAYDVFNITGVVVLGIKTQYHHQISPLILGGGAVLSLTEQTYQTPPYPQGVEAGTNNDPKIWLLIYYFQYYINHQQSINDQLTKWIDTNNLVKGGLRFTYYDHDRLLICNYNYLDPN